LVALGVAGLTPSVVEAKKKDLVVYSARKENLIRPTIQAFEKETGIGVILLTGKAGELARRIEIEQGTPQGDVFLGTAAGIAELLRRKGLLAPYASPRTETIAAEFKAADGTWVGVTGRVRVIIYNKALVREKDLPTSFFDLTTPRWKGKVAVASMGERTTVSWLAAIMALKGEAFTTRYVRALKANGLKVLKNNTEVRRAVARGEYPLGITNHYYYMIQLREDPASPVGILYPDQGPDQMGTPMATITAAIIQGAKHMPEATAFLDFLLQPEGNRLLTEGKFELPLLNSVKPVGGEEGIKGLGEFKQAPVTQVEMADFEPLVEKRLATLLIP
ncbi:MAG: extracellular solute-binding protein, partial [Nitrospinota bacterium]